MARNATLDHARLWAAFGIVLFHADGPGAAIGYAGLPFFTMMLVLLAWPAATDLPFGQFAHNRAMRLLMPWIGWSMVYGALKLAEAGFKGQPLSTEFAPSMLLTGPAIHLWFLPFAFAASLALVPLARLHRHLALPRMGQLIALGALTLSALVLGQESGSLPVPLAQWVFALPAAILGLAFIGITGGTGLAAVAGLAAAVVLAAGALGVVKGLLQFALAAGALVLCLAFPRHDTALSRLAATLALGVYLCHRLILSLLDRLTPLEPGSLGHALAALTGALGLAYVLHLASRALTMLRKTRPAPHNAA